MRNNGLIVLLVLLCISVYLLYDVVSSESTIKPSVTITRIANESITIYVNDKDYVVFYAKPMIECSDDGSCIDYCYGDICIDYRDHGMGYEEFKNISVMKLFDRYDYNMISNMTDEEIVEKIRYARWKESVLQKKLMENAKKAEQERINRTLKKVYFI